MAEQDMTLDTGKVANIAAFIHHDVLSDHEKHVLLKTLIKCLRLLCMSNIFVCIRIDLYLVAFHRNLTSSFLCCERTKKLFSFSAAKCFLNRPFPSLIYAYPYGGSRECRIL